MYQQFLSWLRSLDPQFAFLVMLPFVVAAVAWLGEVFRRKKRHSRDQPLTDNERP